MYDVCIDTATKFEDNRDFEAFKLDVMMHLAMEPQGITEDEFAKGDLTAIGDKLYNQVKEYYARKTAAISENILPALTQILNENGDRVENIVIPFTDGIRGIQVYANLKEAVATNGRSVYQTLEKNMTLALIDDAWKDHLRAMDDLRNSVQMASYEQKDPLLIYKFEAFNLFKQMMLETNKTITSFLLRAGIPMQDAPPQAVDEIPHHTDMSELQMNKEEIDEAGQDYAADEQDIYNEDTAVRRTPVQAGPKIGRNDPCPCGSGKKYKSCHGRGLQ
jgi:preprotein translocase subunit SecA